MEEIGPAFVKKLSDHHHASASQANHSPKEITSLPNMPSLKQLQLSKLSRMNSIERTFALPEQSFTLSIHELVDLDKFSDENIYGKVYAFIKEIMNNHAQHFDILRKFEQIQVELRSNFKKSIKLFPVKSSALRSKENSLGELDNNIPAAEQVKKRKKVCFREENQESISIKLINSRNNDITSLSKTSFKENISLAKLVNFQEKVVLEEMQSAENLDDYKGNIDSQSRLSGEERSSSSSQEGCGRTSFKKISIVMFQEYDEKEDKDSQLFSSQSHVSLKDLDLPKLRLSEMLIEEIFDSPSPFLINLSLCLLFKFFMKSKFQPEVGQIGWLLGVSTMVAYKIFVDESIEGLAEYYSKVLKIKSEDLLFLQRWFLSGINYEVVISNLHYMQMLMRLSKDSKP